jgi:hypothetical protein
LGLYAYDFHVFRSTCHKPNYVSYTAQHLATQAALHPKVRNAVRHMTSMSTLGRIGSSVYPDKKMEMSNKLSEQRSGLGGDLDTKLHNGPELDVLQHVVHCQDENLGRDAGVREPIRPSLLNGAQLLREAIVAQLGTNDLTVHTNINVFWHTGLGVDVTTGNVQHKMPQKWMWQVASGCVPHVNICKPNPNKPCVPPCTQDRRRQAPPRP